MVDKIYWKGKKEIFFYRILDIKELKAFVVIY